MTNRENTDTWVRIAIVLIGMVAILRGVEVLHPVVNILMMFPREGVEFRELLRALFGTLIAPSVLIFGGCILIRYCQNISVRLCNTPSKPTPYWEYATYRLGFMLCGILAISWALPKLGQVCHNLAIRDNPMSVNLNLRQSAWITLFWLCIQCGIGGYLIAGSPNIIKWQMKRGEGSNVADTPEEGEDGSES